MCDLDLRRKCGYKPRSRAEPPRPSAHGGARSFSAFMGLPEEGRAAACEMDTVTGLKSDRRCLLTLYSRPFRFQLALLMPGKTAAATESVLDMLERAAPKARNTPRADTERAPRLPPSTSITHPATASTVAAYQRQGKRSPKRTRPKIPATGGALPIATIVPTATPVKRTAEKKVS